MAECPPGFYWTETSGCIPISTGAGQADPNAKLPPAPYEQNPTPTQSGAANPPAQSGPSTAPGPSASPAATATSGGGGGGGGGGTGGGGGNKKKPDVGPLGDQYGLAQDIMKQLTDAMTGVTGRWNDAAMQDIYAGVISDAESARQASKMSMEGDLAARGLSRSAAAVPLLSAADAQATKARSEGLRQIRIQAKTEAYDDKMAALDRAEKHLQNLRQYELGKEANAAQFAQAAAQVQAASIQVEGQKEMLKMQLAHDTEMFNYKTQQAANTQNACIGMAMQWGADDFAAYRSCL